MALKLLLRLMKFSCVHEQVFHFPSYVWPSMGQVLIDSEKPASQKYWTHFILWEIYAPDCRKSTSSKNHLGGILWKQAQEIARHGVTIKSLPLFSDSISLKEIFGKYAALSRNTYRLQQVKINEADQHEIAPDHGDMYVEVLTNYLNLWYPPNRALSPQCIEMDAIQQTHWENSTIEFELDPKRSINKLKLVPTTISLIFESSDKMYQFIEAAHLKHLKPVEKKEASISDYSHAQESMFDDYSSSASNTSILKDLQVTSQPSAAAENNFEWQQDMSQFQGSPQKGYQSLEKSQTKSEQCNKSQDCNFDSIKAMGPPDARPQTHDHFSQTQSMQCENNQLAPFCLSTQEHFAVTVPSSQCFNSSSNNVLDRVRNLETEIVSMKAVYQFQITEKEVELQQLIERNTKQFNEYIQQKVKSAFLQ